MMKLSSDKAITKVQAGKSPDTTIDCYDECFSRRIMYYKTIFILDRREG